MPVTGTDTLSKIIEDLKKKEEQARLSNLQRYEQIQRIWDEIIRRYEPGGTFEARALEQLAAQKEREVGAATQRLISSGLFGTQAAAGVGMQWERTVGAPARLRLEDIMMQRLSQAQIGKAQAIERREDIYPDYGLISQLIAQAAAAPRGVTRIMMPSQPFPSLPGRVAPPPEPETTPYYRTPEYYQRLEKARQAAAQVRESMAAQRPLPKTVPGAPAKPSYVKVGEKTGPDGKPIVIWRNTATGNLIYARKGYPPTGGTSGTTSATTRTTPTTTKKTTTKTWYGFAKFPKYGVWAPRM